MVVETYYDERLREVIVSMRIPRSFIVLTNEQLPPLGDIAAICTKDLQAYMDRRREYRPNSRCVPPSRKDCRP